MDPFVLNRIVDCWPHGIIVLDHQGQVAHWNQWMERASGHDAEQALDRTLEQIFGQDAVAPRLKSAVRLALESGTSSVLTRTFTPHALPLFAPSSVDTKMPLSVRVRSVRDAEGLRVCMIDVHDETLIAQREELLLTQQKALGEQAAALAQGNLELQALNEELDRFVYHAGHDLKAPLRNLGTFCSFLRDDLGEDITPQVGEDLAHIVGCTERMTALVQDLLELAKSTHEELAPVPVSLQSCADQALLVLTPLMTSIGAQVCNDQLPEVHGNARHITQLLQNLIENALRHGHGKGEAPRLHITCSDGVIGVRDEGPGLKPEDREKVFSPFTRLNAGSKGSGLGLVICKQIVERHGGRIWCDSELGEGCHFQFTLAA